MNPRREFPYYLVTGAILGILAGLLVSWVLLPVQYVNTSPVTLRADYKDEYRGLIAAAYQSTGDLERARTRLGVLGDPDPSAVLLEQSLRASGDLSVVLENLSRALLANPQPNPTATLPPELPTNAPPSETPAAPPSQTPTPSPSPTLLTPPPANRPHPAARPPLRSRRRLHPPPQHASLIHPFRAPPANPQPPLARPSRSPRQT
jgi:hypothetical protein